ncbi:MAG: endonuclease/exonuclease/phosphatase family protein [Bacteroidota bacterium]|nr:endonuclease/exonuclease/phosphatase family protein [Bacteroidota bacterium]
MKRTPLLFTSLPAILLVSLAHFMYLDHPDCLVKKRTLKVLTYNIHHAGPPSRPQAIDLDAIAKVITEHNPDLVALQEVDSHTARSGPFNQAEELGRRTGMTAHFFRSIDYDGGEYGIAILSRLPIVDVNLYPLPRMEGNGGEPRILATARIQLSAREQFLFACTHLDAQRDSTNRNLQIKAIAGLLRDVAVPIIIAGDFNAIPESQEIGTLDNHFTRTCDPCVFTIPADHPSRAIDFIAYTPAKAFKVKMHSVIPARYASDHLPVSAVLEVNF